jgi:hypothetical protein
MQVRWLCVAMLLSSGVCVAEDRIMLDAYTKHTSECQSSYAKKCEPWQQPHRISWQHDFNETLSTDVGFGTNSYGGGSMHMGGAYKPLKLGTFSAGVWGVYATGYTCAQLKTCNMLGGAVLSGQIGKGRWDVLWVPAIGNGTVSVTQLRMGVAF